LKNGGFLTAKDLENYLFTLNDDEIFTIVGFLPDPLRLTKIDYSILKEVIRVILDFPAVSINAVNFKLPDWNKKIEINNLSHSIKLYLDTASISVPSLEEYLNNNGTFIGDELQEKMVQVYAEKRVHYQGDELFLSIVEVITPQNKMIYQTPVYVIMAKYFESCDIFERP